RFAKLPQKQKKHPSPGAFSVIKPLSRTPNRDNPHIPHTTYPITRTTLFPSPPDLKQRPRRVPTPNAYATIGGSLPVATSANGDGFTRCFGGCPGPRPVGFFAGSPSPRNHD